jgi:radical SAM superfamily enzyme YgiQ (UPF0313 family)
MKVLFSNPPWWETPEGNMLRKRWRAGVRAGSRWPFTYLARSAPDQYRFGDYLPYPFFMGYATTYAARETGAAVHFRDSIALRESYERYFQYLEAERYEYIFIETATPSWDNDGELIREINRRLPDTKIVVTGPITTTRSDAILGEYPVHACVRGEYEKGSVRVLNGESGLVDFDMLSKAEMNAAPFPYFDATYAHRYWDANPKGQRSPHAQIWSSRGCPFKCIFCVWPAAMTGNDPDGASARTVRHYSPEYMEAFIRELLERYQFKCIYFDDDTFNLGTKHTEAMCAVMSRIGVPWSAMCRADTIKLETWRLMQESGCFGVKLGFESGNQYVVDKIVNKHLDLEYSREVVHELKRIGMTVHGTFTYGLPGETKEQMMDTRRFIASLPFDSVQESGTAEIEGTPLHTLRERGNLEQYEGARIDLHYQREVDGNKKWQKLVDDLKSN